MEYPTCPLIDDWIKKMWYIDTTEYYSGVKMNDILPFERTPMNLEGIMQ